MFYAMVRDFRDGVLYAAGAVAACLGSETYNLVLEISNAGCDLCFDSLE